MQGGPKTAGMRLSALVLIALLGTAFAGCLAGLDSITAKDGLADARDAAEAFAGGTAVLTGVFSLEPFSEFYDEDDDVEVRIHLDETPGDGKAPGWIYEFAVGTDLVVIGYSSGLGVLFEARDGNVFDEDGGDVDAITGWNTDSDDAAAALNAHEDWPENTDATSVFWTLQQADECPIWMAEHIDLDSEEFTYGTVDGCTGEVLAVEAEWPFSFSCHSGYSFGTSLTLPLVSQASYETYLDTEGFVEFEVQDGSLVGAVSWTLQGPEGILAEGTGSDGGLFEELPPGTYVLAFEGSVAAGTTYYYLASGSCT